MNELKLTQAELHYLETYLLNFDRGGYYTANYNLTGSEGSILEGRISTFSGAVGGTAYVANIYLQDNYGAGRALESYKSIYVLSQKVAVSSH